MQTKASSVFLGVLLSAVFSSNLSAGSDSYTVVNGPKNFYYGHVSKIDGQEGPEPYILREYGTQRIPAILNMPLMPGDTIVTPGAGRLEIQFDNGTILRLDAATEIKIETILAETLTTRNMMTNLVLSRGQVYAMFKEYSPREICQFLLPTAAVRLRHQTVAILGTDEDGASDIRVRRGKADVLYGPDAEALKKHDVLKGERITIGPDHRYALQPFPEGTPFESWNISQNDNFEPFHEGLSMLPKPVRFWPLAVQYFAEKYSNLFGEWIYDVYLGYVWRPADNDRPFAGGWHPFFSGQWITAGKQLYWVSSEPWGWIPYHLGVWHWDHKRGWLWIPGSAFAPAWVEWAFFADNFAWRPYSLWDWMTGYGGDFYGGWEPSDSGWEVHVNSRKTNKVTKDQLAQPSRPSYEMPREFTTVVKALQAGIANRDPELLASLREQAKFGFVVSGERLISTGIRLISTALLRESAPRVRDWNPDVRTAIEYGVSIRYDSGSNKIYCPELRMQSGDRWSLLDRWAGRGEMGESRFEGSLEQGHSGSVDRSSNGDSQTGITSGSDRSGGSSSSGAEKK